jgi:hypothetical protein
MRSTPFTSVCTEHQQAQQADSAEAIKSTPTSCSKARMGLYYVLVRITSKLYDAATAH